MVFDLQETLADVRRNFENFQAYSCRVPQFAAWHDARFRLSHPHVYIENGLPRCRQLYAQEYRYFEQVIETLSKTQFKHFVQLVPQFDPRTRLAMKKKMLDIEHAREVAASVIDDVTSFDVLKCPYAEVPPVPENPDTHNLRVCIMPTYSKGGTYMGFRNRDDAMLFKLAHGGV